MTSTLTGVPDVAMDETRFFGDVPARLVVSDAAVAAALRLVLRDRPSTSSADASTVVTAAKRSHSWQVFVDHRLVRALAPHTPAARVAEEVLETACATIAEQTGRLLLTGVLLSKAGKTLALIGEDLDSARVIGFHLHSRGWNAVAFRHSFLGRDGLTVVGVATTAIASSFSIGQMPLRYRPAVEASRWYDTGFDISFYAVDTNADDPRSLAPVQLSHVVLVDGEIDDEPLLEAIADARTAHALGAHALAAHLHFCHLTLASAVPTCNVLERWIESTEPYA